MANEVRELTRFCNDPRYREKVIARVHKDMDKEYNQRIKKIETQKNALIVSRNNEISRISQSRWESYAKNKLMVNRTEGVINVNSCNYFFSSIYGADINMVPGYRMVTTETSSTKGRKHASIGGAIVGGMIAGPVGAVVGGAALGKNKSKTQGRVVTNQIPTCMHLGVMVNLNGFSNEIVLVSQQVDQSSPVFQKAYQEAQNIVALLGVLARTPVPQMFLRPEEEQSVKFLDQQINNKQLELEAAKANVPTYAIPAMYRTAEQSSMSDEEYLQYLRETDSQRMAQAVNNQQTVMQPVNYSSSPISIDTTEVSTGRRVGKIIFNVSFWHVSVIFLLLALVMFASKGVVSGFIFLFTSILVNPSIGDLIYKKVVKYPRWIVAIILTVGFFAGILTVPTSPKNSDLSASESAATETTT